ncbi:MAG: galactose oxidase [Micrococcales bacterium]|nr:galactose oxidase [Micrococcales bacterium]
MAVTASPASAPAEEWDHLDVDILRPSHSGAVCITCQHFRYEVGRHCVTLLTCPIHQGLISQGEHLSKRCAQWVARREVREGWCPEGG